MAEKAYTPRLKKDYDDRIANAMTEKFGYKNKLEVPKLEKIVINMSIIALGVMPYITASIVVQLGATLYQPWQALKKEGETGRKKLNQYTRYLTVLLTTVQGYWIAVGLESLGAAQGISAVVEPGLMFRVAATISLVGGTLFLMWIGEQITSRGIGNGVSLIIMAGIVATLPRALAQLFEGGRSGTMNPLLVATIVGIAIGLVLFICFVERAQRRVPIQYPKRQTARGMRSLVLGVEAVLPDGSIHDGLSGLKKDNRGYNLDQLLLGSEGTLGVITAVALRLVPAVGTRAVAWTGLADPERALELLRFMQSRTDRIEGFEIVPADSLDLVLQHIPGTRSPLEGRHEWHDVRASEFPKGTKRAR